LLQSSSFWLVLASASVSSQRATFCKHINLLHHLHLILGVSTPSTTHTFLTVQLIQHQSQLFTTTTIIYSILFHTLLS
jgi:hypothetical protein